MQIPDLEIPELQGFSNQLAFFYNNDPTNSMVFHPLAETYAILPKDEFGEVVETVLDGAIGQYLLMALARAVAALPNNSSDVEQSQAVMYTLSTIKRVVGPIHILKFLALGRTAIETSCDSSDPRRKLFLESIHLIEEDIKYTFKLEEFISNEDFRAALQFFYTEYSSKLESEPNTDWTKMFGWAMLEIIHKYIKQEPDFILDTSARDIQIFIRDFLRFAESTNSFTNEEILVFIRRFLEHHFLNKNGNHNRDSVLANILIAVESLLNELAEGSTERVEL